MPLPLKTQLESLSAVKEFLADGYVSNTKSEDVDILVQRHGKVIFDKIISLFTALDSSHARLDIYWEDVGITNFRELGLKGTYYTFNCKMRQEGKYLILTPEKETTITITGKV